jgi:hypothetical protein
MSRGFDAVNDINDSKELWKLAVRVEDLWTVTHRGKEHLEFLILDKQVLQFKLTVLCSYYVLHDNNTNFGYCLFCVFIYYCLQG